MDLDLDKIVTLNTFKVLNQYGYVLNGAKTLQEECDKNLVGGIIVKEGNIDIEIVYEKRKNGEKFGINPVGVYNEFNVRRHTNSQLIEEIREKTRDYLMIDKKW